MLYEDTHEASNELTEESDDSDNEADFKLEPLEDEDAEYEINPLIKILVNLM